MAKVRSITISAAGQEEWLGAINEKINKKQLAMNSTKCEAFRAMWEEMEKKVYTDNSGVIENLEKQIEEQKSKIAELQETNHRLSEQTIELNKELAAAQQGGGIPDAREKWIMPANMGSVCLALIMDESPDFADIQDVESACAFILRPYQREGKFIPDAADLENYQNALEHGFGQDK